MQFSPTVVIILMANSGKFTHLVIKMVAIPKFIISVYHHILQFIVLIPLMPEKVVMNSQLRLVVLVLETVSPFGVRFLMIVLKVLLYGILQDATMKSH